MRKELYYGTVLFVISVFLVFALFWDKSNIATMILSSAIKANVNNSTNPATTGRAFSLERRRLPSLKNGGIVIFIHIPKTGGTTIRELVKYRKDGRRSKVNYIYLTGPREFNYTMNRMNERLAPLPSAAAGGRGGGGVGTTIGQEVVFVEYHALDRTCPTFLQLATTILPDWKQRAQQQNIPLFMMSLVREPISFAISFFNFYHGMHQNPRRFDYVDTSDNNNDNAVSERQFLKHTIANPQCLFLAHNEDAYTKTGQDLRESFTWEECQRSFAGMVQLMDWIGTTDRIRNETLPLLRTLFSTNNHTKKLIRNLNKTANPSSAAGLVPKFQQEYLSKKAKEEIRSKTMWDLGIYTNVQRRFSYNDWMDTHTR